MSDQPSGLTDQRLDEIEQRAAAMFEHADLGNDEDQREAEHLSGTDVPALLGEVRRLRTRTAELEVGLNDLAALVGQWYDRSEKAQARVAELECPTVEARAALADAVVEWSGQTVGAHVPTVDAIVELINPQSEPRVCGDQLVDWTCSLRDGRHLDGKHRDEFNGAWWDQSSVPPYSNRARPAGEVECACCPAPHRESDGTYSHWVGCPVADAQQQADASATPTP